MAQAKLFGCGPYRVYGLLKTHLGGLLGTGLALPFSGGFMKKIFLLLSVAGSFACSTVHTKNTLAEQNPKTVPANSSAVDMVQVEKTMDRLKQQIQELETLEEQIYSKSIKGDVALEKKLEKKISRYGTVETLEANLRVLDELKAQSHPGDSVKTLSN
jgi:hypothetical protein